MSLQEYEAQNTPEAVVCKDLDKFEMILQAYEYEMEAGKPGWLEEFFASTEGVFSYPCVREWVNALRQIRSSTAGADKEKSEKWTPSFELTLSNTGFSLWHTNAKILDVILMTGLITILYVNCENVSRCGY